MSTLESWGDSAAADRIRDQVAGIAPDLRWRQIFVVLQAYVDDSVSEAGTFVLAGYIGSSADWLSFSNEWSPLAREWGVLINKTDETRIFKMAQMRQFGRQDRIAAFYRVIENHNILPFSFAINRRVFANAKSRLTMRRSGRFYAIDLNLYHFLFNCVVSNVVRIVDEHPDVFSKEESIDFYFDDQSEKKQILESWDRFVHNSAASFKRRLSTTPRFESDTKFMPLQAADFWAWWSSHWADAGGVDSSFGGLFNVHKGFVAAHHTIQEEQAVTIMKTIIRSESPPGTLTYDVRFAF